MTIDEQVHFTKTNNAKGWQECHALASRLHVDDARLSVADYRLILDAIRTGLPVIVTWKDSIGTATATCILTDLTVWPVTGGYHNGSSNMIRVHRWGFAHDIWFSQLASVTAPDTQYAHD